MKIIVNLKYHGAPFDARIIIATRGRHTTPQVDLEIGNQVDAIKADHDQKKKILDTARALVRKAIANKTPNKSPKNRKETHR